MDFSLEERSELRLAIVARAHDPDASYDTKRILGSAYANLAAADGLKTAMPGPTAVAPNPPPKPTCLHDILDRFSPVVETERDATAKAVLALEDRIARSPLLRKYGRRA